MSFSRVTTDVDPRRTTFRTWNESAQRGQKHLPVGHVKGPCSAMALSLALRAIVVTLVVWTAAISVVVILDNSPSKHNNLPKIYRPFRPVGIRVINGIGILLEKLGLLDRAVPLDPDYLIASACSTLHTYPKLHCVLRYDYGDYWHESFHRLTSALQHANLTFLGRVVAQGQLSEILQTRGRLLNVFSEQKSSDGALHDPIFVVGLPRSGTTLLSRLLSIDPANRAPTLAEYMDPVPQPPPPPPLDASEHDKDSYHMAARNRLKDQQWKLDQYKSLAPGLDSMHPLNATSPEECLIIMNYAMDSEQFAVTYPIHEYMEWLLDFEHHRDVLQWNKRVLQHLQKDDPYGPRRWVLKTPYYLTMMDDLRSVYPNAKIIHTHRNPEQSVLSVSSVIAKLHSIVTDDIDLHRIGSQQASIHETMLQKAITVRRKWAREDPNSKSSFRIVDVHLQDLQRDPVQTVNKIYNTLFDTDLDTGAVALMRQWLEQNPRTKHGTHRPALTDFGLEGRMDSGISREYGQMFGAKMALSCDTKQMSDKQTRKGAKNRF